jgi:hypothetical protein
LQDLKPGDPLHAARRIRRLGRHHDSRTGSKRRGCLMRTPAGSTASVTRPRLDAQAPKPRGQPETEPTVELKPPVVPRTASQAGREPSTAEPLYALVRAHSKPAHRPVMTPQGSGKLWQVFANRVGVILSAAPGRVTYFDPGDIQLAPGSLPETNRATLAWVQEAGADRVVRGTSHRGGFWPSLGRTGLVLQL